MNRGRGLSWVGLLGAVVCSAQPAGLAAQQTAQYRSDVDLRLVRIAVLGGDPGGVDQLAREDFLLWENDVQRPVRLVLSPTDSTLEIALVLDYSTSVTRDFPQARATAETFLDSLVPGDCVHLLPFNQQVGPGRWGRADSQGLRERVHTYPTAEGTKLYDALLNAVAVMSAAQASPETECSLQRSQGSSRRAVVVLTDGIDEGSVSSFADVLFAVWEADLPVFVLAVGDAALTSRQTRRRTSRSMFEATPRYRESSFGSAHLEQIKQLQAELAELARVSGGHVVTAPELSVGYSDLLDLLRGYYVLGYEPEDDVPGWHDLRVEIATGAQQVIVQSGFYIEPPHWTTARVDGAAARRAYGAGDLEEAAERFASAAESAPTVGDPFFGLALTFETLGQWEDAVTAYESAIWSRPGSPVFHAGLGAALRRSGDADRAAAHLVRAIRGGLSTERLRVGPLETVASTDSARRLLDATVLHWRRPNVTSLESQIAVREATLAIGRLLDASPEIVLTEWPLRNVSSLHLRVTSLDAHRAGTELELFDQTGKRVAVWPARFDDLRDTEQVARVAKDVITKLLQRVSDGGL